MKTEILLWCDQGPCVSIFGYSLVSLGNVQWWACLDSNQGPPRSMSEKLFVRPLGLEPRTTEV
jgi:hypothetical protein